MVVGRYLAGIAALPWHPYTRKYLLLRRSEAKDYASGVWECVTGRLNQGEGFEDAVHREVREELGVRIRLDFIIGTTHFYRGPVRPENELVGVVYSCTLERPESIQLSAEHSEYRWLTFEEVPELLTADDTSTDWIRRIIARAEEIRIHTPDHLLEVHRRTGFELG